MRAKAIATTLALCAVLIVVLPSGALAAAHPRRPPQEDAFLTLPGSNGFEFVLFFLPHRAVGLSASKSLSGTGSETVSYASAASGKVMGGLDGRQLNLGFGRLGHFRGHFVPKSTRTQKPESGCTGEPTIDENGVFIGSFRFHGERGFTEIDATRAQGAITRSGVQRCVETSRPRDPEREKARRVRAAKEREGEFRLLAGSEAGDYNVQVDRRQGRGASKPPSVTVSASSDERLGALQIDRSTEVHVSGSRASAILQTPNLSEPMAEATLQPPAPFSGSATFASDSSDSASWTGDLAVALPGAAPLPLTGDDIAAGACLGASTCTKTLPKLLQLTLETSGGSGYFFGFATTAVAEPRG